MASWPSTLPAPQSGGYAITPVDQAIKTDMESGAARTRRRTSARNDKVSVSWRFTDAQLATFRTWFEDGAAGAAGGAAWFTINLALGTTGIVVCTARFGNAPKITHLGGLKWQLSAELEVR